MLQMPSILGDRYCTFYSCNDDYLFINTTNGSYLIFLSCKLSNLIGVYIRKILHGFG